MDVSRWEYKIALAVSAGNILLIILLIGEWWYANHVRENILHDIRKPVTVAYQVEPLPAYTFLQHPVEHYAEMVNRPLFNRDRKPLEIIEEEERAEEVIERPVKPFMLKLTGSLMTPDGIMALFENPGTSKAIEKFQLLAEGEEYQGWTVKSILPDKVIIVSRGNEKVISLMKSSPIKPLIPRRTVRRTPARQQIKRNKQKQK